VDAIQFQISFRELRPIASIYDRTIVTSQSLQYDFY